LAQGTEVAVRSLEASLRQSLGDFIDVDGSVPDPGVGCLPSDPDDDVRGARGVVGASLPVVQEEGSSASGAAAEGDGAEAAESEAVAAAGAPRADDVVLYTFGSPRTGNRVVARMFNARVPLAYRLVSDGDFVTGLPRSLILTYKHVGTQIVLDRFGNVIVDPSFIETEFRGRRKTSLRAHAMNAYRRGLINARTLEGLPLSDVLVSNPAWWRDGVGTLP
jgi:hypothetical protein